MFNFHYKIFGGSAQIIDNTIEQHNKQNISYNQRHTQYSLLKRSIKLKIIFLNANLMLIRHNNLEFYSIANCINQSKSEGVIEIIIYKFIYLNIFKILIFDDFNDFFLNIITIFIFP